MVIYIHELITLWYLNKTNDGLCIQEKCYSMVKDNVDDVSACEIHPHEDQGGW